MPTPNPTRADTDAQILTALTLPTTSGYRIDRTDPYRYLVRATDPTDPAGIRGRAVLDATGPSPHARRWYLGCLDCDTPIEPLDAGLCPPCRRTATPTQD